MSDDAYEKRIERAVEEWYRRCYPLGARVRGIHRLGLVAHIVRESATFLAAGEPARRTE